MPPRRKPAGKTAKKNPNAKKVRVRDIEVGPPKLIWLDPGGGTKKGGRGRSAKVGDKLSDAKFKKMFTEVSANDISLTAAELKKFKQRYLKNQSFVNKSMSSNNLFKTR